MSRLITAILLSFILVTALISLKDTVPRSAKPLPQTEEKQTDNTIYENSDYILYQQDEKLQLENKNDRSSHAIDILPETSLRLTTKIVNKPPGQIPLINDSISLGVVLSGTQNNYVVSLEPDFAVLGIYPEASTDRDYILVKKQENKLFFYRQGLLAEEYPVSTGKMSWYTPEGDFQIVNKLPYPKGHDPQAPMGPRWMGLAVPYSSDKRGNNQNGGPDPRSPVGQKFGIHGTNDESTIGTHASGGCIRMYNRHVIQLYDMVDTGTTVKIEP